MLYLDLGLRLDKWYNIYLNLDIIIFLIIIGFAEEQWMISNGFFRFVDEFRVPFFPMEHPQGESVWNVVLKHLSSRAPGANPSLDAQLSYTRALSDTTGHFFRVTHYLQADWFINLWITSGNIL